MFDIPVLVASFITASPVQGNVSYIQSSTIDFTQTQDVVIVTTAANQSFIVKGVIAECDEYIGVTQSSINGSWGWSLPDYADMGYTTLTMYGQDEYQHYDQGFTSVTKAVPPNSQLIFRILNPGQGTSFKGKIIVIGLYI